MFKKIRNYFAKPIFSLSEKMGFIAGVIALFYALAVDTNVLKFIGSVRIPLVDSFMLFMTDYGMLISVLMLVGYVAHRKKFHEIFLMAITGASTLQISYLAKVIIRTPRPFAAAEVATIPLTLASGFSMPSLHTAFCFSLWPFLPRIFPNKILRFIAQIIILTVAFSRLYLGVHYLSDLIAGGMIGYAMAKFWIYLQQEHKILNWFIGQVKDKFELRRQVMHLVTGVAIILLLKLHLLNAPILLVILFCGGILSIIAHFYSLPITDKILVFFERPQNIKHFGGKGSFFLVLGCFLSLQFFRYDIALAAIAIMSVGDSITTVVGTYFGKIKNPLNPKKHLEGTAIAIVASTFAAFFFVPFPIAFAGSFVGMLFESISVRYISKILDDNVIIPLVAGYVMTLLI